MALDEHELTVTHSDGFPVIPTRTDAVLIGMGERYDVVVTLRDGVFPLVAVPEGKRGQARALVRTGPGAVPAAGVRPRQLDRRVLLGTDLSAGGDVRLPARQVDRQHVLALSGSMRPYRWTIGGRTFPDAAPVPVEQGERGRLRFENRSMMFHPMHVHRDNPSQWATHCHNIYHAESGMMATLTYRS